MKKYKKLVVLTALTAALSTSALAAGTGITDIRNYWGKDAIQYFYDNQYVSAANGQFRPDDEIQRRQRPLVRTGDRVPRR